MREYKFRGKTKSHFGDGHGNVVISKNTWIYGGITYDEDRVWIDTKYHGQIIVDKETVGQFTGLHDKNGKEIYEGDIVSKETFDDTKPNYRNISYAKVVWIEELASYHLVNKDEKILWDLAYDKYNIKVSGNIYENSDLLKGADNIE